MAEPAIRRMTLDEFLWWDDGTDTRYELIDGFPVAMAPPARAHGILCARLAGAIDPETAYAEVFRRQGSGWFIEIVRGRDADLYLSSLQLGLPMAEVYEGMELESDLAS